MYGQPASEITDPDAWIASLEERQRIDIEMLDRRIRAKAPQLDRRMDHGMLAYGHYTYKYPSKREGEWFVLGLAATKAGTSIYVSPLDIEPYRDRFPTGDFGRGCIRVKRVSDLDEAALDQLIGDAAALDGTHFTGG
jgi:Domain of unknown function (DU1801)